MSDPTTEEESLISQDDIDKLLDSSSFEEAEEKISNSDSVSADADADELGELSQDDIDQLMNSNTTTPEDSDAGDDTEDDDMELISQDDIDELMSSNTASDEEQIKEPVIEDTSPDDDGYIIDESDAVDVQDSLITQETLDDLIKHFDNEATTEPVILDEEPVSEAAALTQPESDPELAVDLDAASVAEPEVQEDIALDDTEDFLKPDSDVAVFDFDDEENDDVTQEDIDALLLESDDDEENEDDILISQDDIDTLLMTADQEDEDVLGDLMDEDVDGSLDDEDDEDDDILESDDFNDSYEDDDEDQVILEEYDEELPAKLKKKKAKAGSKWYKSKLVIACASALIVLGIAVPIAYFVFFSGQPGQETQSGPIAKLAVEREIEIETVDIHIKEQGNMKKPGNMILKDFVILTADLSKNMAYITADISIDYSDQRAYHEIKNNLSFYRDLIYDSINKSFDSDKGNEVTEADILWMVETTLKKVLPGHYINRVSFKTFKSS
jgi:pilus assembly protein FimV